MHTADTTVAALDSVIAEYELATHPLYAAWADGTLTRDHLRAYALRCYPYVEYIPRFMHRIASNTPSIDVRRYLLARLNDAEGERPTHTELWLRFCSSFGLFSDSVRRAEPVPATSACIDALRDSADSSDVAALSALYVHTRLFAGVKHVQLEGLAEHFDMYDGPARQYFELIEHSAGGHVHDMRELIIAAIEDSPNPETAAALAETTARTIALAIHAMLDASFADVESVAATVFSSRATV